MRFAKSLTRRRMLEVLAAIGVAGCQRSRAGGGASGKHQIVFKHQPLWGDPAPFRGLLDEFRAKNPDVEVITEPLPNASDVVHQYFLTALEGGARDFDVFVMDVVWVPEFARAGWITDLTDVFPPEVMRRDFLPGAAASVLVDGKTYAIPWYIDVGVFYYRADLVPRAPKTYEELEAFAADAQNKHVGLFGYVWQGRQ